MKIPENDQLDDSIIRKERNLRGWSQAELAKRAEFQGTYGNQFVSLIEKQFNVVVNILRELGISYEEAKRDSQKMKRRERWENEETKSD